MPKGKKNKKHRKRQDFTEDDESTPGLSLTEYLASLPTFPSPVRVTRGYLGINSDDSVAPGQILTMLFPKADTFVLATDSKQRRVAIPMDSSVQFVQLGLDPGATSSNWNVMLRSDKPHLRTPQTIAYYALFPLPLVVAFFEDAKRGLSGGDCLVLQEVVTNQNVLVATPATSMNEEEPDKNDIITLPLDVGVKVLPLSPEERTHTYDCLWPSVDIMKRTLSVTRKVGHKIHNSSQRKLEAKIRTFNASKGKKNKVKSSSTSDYPAFRQRSASTSEMSLPRPTSRPVFSRTASSGVSTSYEGSRTATMSSIDVSQWRNLPGSMKNHKTGSLTSNASMLAMSGYGTSSSRPLTAPAPSIPSDRNAPRVPGRPSQGRSDFHFDDDDTVSYEHIPDPDDDDIQDYAFIEPVHPYKQLDPANPDAKEKIEEEDEDIYSFAKHPELNPDTNNDVDNDDDDSPYTDPVFADASGDDDDYMMPLPSFAGKASIEDVTVDDVIAALTQFGLEEHVESFRTEQIDGFLLFSLDVDMMNELGVTEPSHLDKIRNLQLNLPE